jgi:hypothetical protein
MTYDRIVAAALAETTSMFRLAEALALDIPPMRPGPSAKTLTAYLEEARQAIIEGGGEPRAVVTLDSYRRTAMWVSGDVPGNYRWLLGVSYSAHESASTRMSYEDFAALPSRKVRDIRPSSKDGPPGSVIPGWSPDQKAEAARELIKDPAVADKVAADPVAASHAAAAIDRHTEQQRELQKGVRRDHDDWPVNPLNLVWEFRQLHKTIDRIAAEVAKRGAIVGPEERDALIEEVAWLRNALGMIESGIKGHSLDLALAKILAGES